MSGSGTMTPIGGGPGTGLSLAQPTPWTLLSLDRYAKVMGVNPAHFWGASAPNADPARMPITGACSSIWFKYAWQESDRVGRYDVAQEIVNAEADIARLLGYYPAPMWIAEDRIEYPRYHRREYFGTGFDIRGQLKSIPATWGRIVEAGRRSATLIGSANVAGGSLVYSDQDADGLYETATITLATTLTDACEIKVYFYGTNADPDWEIREPRSVEITGGNVVIHFDAWLLIDPELYEELPDEDGLDLIDVGVTTNFVSGVDVYRIFASPSEASAVFSWEDDLAECADADETCTPTTQNGCLRFQNHRYGVVRPVPASYGDSTWTIASSWEGGREPDYVDLWYRAGDVNGKVPRDLACAELSQFWAQTIAWLATARLPRPICTCGNLEALQEWLMMDTKENRPELSIFTPDEVSRNPFGTRNGEIAAWKRIEKLVEKRTAVALV